MVLSDRGVGPYSNIGTLKETIVHTGDTAQELTLYGDRPTVVKVVWNEPSSANAVQTVQHRSLMSDIGDKVPVSTHIDSRTPMVHSTPFLHRVNSDPTRINTTSALPTVLLQGLPPYTKVLGLPVGFLHETTLQGGSVLSLARVVLATHPLAPFDTWALRPPASVEGCDYADISLPICKATKQDTPAHDDNERRMLQSNTSSPTTAWYIIFSPTDTVAKATSFFELSTDMIETGLAGLAKDGGSGLARDATGGVQWIYDSTEALKVRMVIYEADYSEELYRSLSLQS